MLAGGNSPHDVTKKTGAHHYTIANLAFQHATTIETRKQILADAALDGANDACAELRSHIGQGKLAPNQLVPIFGVLVDKAIALRADPTIHVEHEHKHIHAHISDSTFSDLLAKLPTANPPPQELSG